MRPRQEQIVFAVAALILGFMAYGLLSGAGSKRTTRRQGTPAEFEHFSAPDVSQALPRPGAPLRVMRAFMAPPSDTRPLPPLPLVEPPRAPLASLFPPPDPGPGPRKFGALLRRELGLQIDPDDVAELFAEVDTGLGDVDYDLGEFKPKPKRRSALDELRAAAPQSNDPLDLLTPAQRALVIESYKREYDWYDDQINLRFGRISNPDRYGLKTDPSRADEGLLFKELKPAEGGAEMFRGTPPIKIERDIIVAFDFAGTITNEIEVRRRRLGDTLRPSTYAQALSLAAYSVRQRLEASRALAIAEELYRLCAAFNAADLEPRLGLARCFEADFAFERAFQEYHALLESFGNRAVVHARLGALEARFFLDDAAEERLRHAIAVDRNSWEARWTLGRFLAERGAFDEALEHLSQANRYVPNDPEALADRVEVRTDLASTNLSAGNIAQAHALFARALAADPNHQRARAGWIATEILAPANAGFNGTVQAPEAGERDAPGSQLLLARGLEALSAGDIAAAMEQLTAAAAADPLRANRAWRALSYLSEVAGFPGEAQRYVELALECDPRDPWALYQQGRLFVQQEDFAGARRSFLAALEQELDFEDALASLGEMAFRRGSFGEAERFLERALSIDPTRVEVLALRGMNLLRLDSLAEARAAFEAGKRLSFSDPVCAAGLAWCTYLAGDSEQAMVSLRGIDDALRGLPEDDPSRVWARDQIVRIADHEQKVEWSDTFERTQIRNDWNLREDAGPTHSIVDDEVVLAGTFTKTGATMLYRTLPASIFVSLEADVWVDPQTSANVGLFVAKERRRSRSTETMARAALLRHTDGSLQVEVQRSGQVESVTDMEQPFPTGRWVRLRIERTGDSSNSAVTFYSEGIPLVENARMATLRAATPIILGLIAEGEPGRPVKVRFDNVKVVYREVN